MSQHKPGSVWIMRDPAQVRNNGGVVTVSDGTIAIWYTDTFGDYRELRPTRRDARLLAKRINQCLDDTR